MMANGWLWAWQDKPKDFTVMLTAAVTAYKAKYNRWPTKVYVNPDWWPGSSKIDLPDIGTVEVLGNGPTQVGNFLMSGNAG